jgi:pimeloyl-ACP methyl ester carboxylesterase
MEDSLLPADRLLPRWRDAVPAAPVVELEGVGHYPQEEAPSRVVAVVRDGP